MATALPRFVLLYAAMYITFALLHLSCMRLIAALVPHGLEGGAFWIMAALCAAALPLALQLLFRSAVR